MNCQTDKEKYSMVLKCVLGPTHWTTTKQAIKQTKKSPNKPIGMCKECKSSTDIAKH